MGCPPQVRSQLSKVDGVEDVKVDFGKKKAVVKVKPGVEPQAVAAALGGKFSGSVAK